MQIAYPLVVAGAFALVFLGLAGVALAGMLLADLLRRSLVRNLQVHRGREAFRRALAAEITGAVDSAQGGSGRVTASHIPKGRKALRLARNRKGQS